MKTKSTLKEKNANDFLTHTEKTNLKDNSRLFVGKQVTNRQDI